MLAILLYSCVQLSPWLCDIGYIIHKSQCHVTEPHNSVMTVSMLSCTHLLSHCGLILVYEWNWCAQTLIISSSTINDFTTSFLHFPPFCTALWHQKSPPPFPKSLYVRKKATTIKSTCTFVMQTSVSAGLVYTLVPNGFNEGVELYIHISDKCFGSLGIHTAIVRLLSDL